MGILNLPIETAINAKVGNLVGMANAESPSIHDYNRNLFDKDDVFVGKYIKSDGTIGDVSNSILSGFIKVSRSVYPTLSFVGRYSGSNMTALRGVSFYDRERNMIYWSRTAADLGSPLSIPDNASFVRVEFQYSSTYPDAWWFVLKYSCFSISPLEFTNYAPGDDGNLLNTGTAFLNRGMYLNGTSIVYDNTGDALCSAPIPVIPGKRYLVGIGGLGGYYFWSLDKTLSIITRIAIENIFSYWVCPANVRYIVFNVKTSGNDIRETGTMSLGAYPAEDAPSPEMLSDNDDVSLFIKRRGIFPFSNIGQVIGIYNKHLVIQTASGTAKYQYSENGFDGPFTAFATSDLPGWASTSIVRIVFFPTASQHGDIRALIFGNKNQVWCSCLAPAYDTGTTYSTGDFCSRSGQNYKCLADNTTGTWDATKWSAVSNVFGYFEQSNVWDLKGNHHWRIGDSDLDPTGVRFRKYFPVTGEASRLNKFYWHNSPVWVNCGGQYARGLLFGNYSTTTNGASQAEPACLFLTLNGKDIYVMYEFGVNGTYKLGSTGNVTRWDKTVYGDDVDFTSFSGSPSGMKLRRRVSVVPTDSDADPVRIFDYDAEVSVSSISGKNITLSDASGISVQDTIVLTGTGTDDYAKVLTTSIDGTTGVGNGSVFIVKSKSGNVITIADGIGNPKNNLFCRHIHGVSEFGQGICIYTGEEYPASWFIYIQPDMNSNTDADTINSTKWETSIVRLNAGAGAHQRSLGVYLRPDGKMISIADSNEPYKSRLSVRGKDIMMGNYGIHIFPLSDIDDATNSISRIPSLNAGYALYKFGNTLFYSDYVGQLYYSRDEGDTWNYICTTGTAECNLIGFDEEKTRFWLWQDSNIDVVLKVKK